MCWQWKKGASTPLWGHSAGSRCTVSVIQCCLTHAALSVLCLWRTCHSSTLRSAACHTHITTVACAMCRTRVHTVTPCCVLCHSPRDLAARSTARPTPHSDRARHQSTHFHPCTHTTQAQVIHQHHRSLICCLKRTHKSKQLDRSLIFTLATALATHFTYTSYYGFLSQLLCGATAHSAHYALLAVHSRLSLHITPTTFSSSGIA